MLKQDRNVDCRWLDSPLHPLELKWIEKIQEGQFVICVMSEKTNFMFFRKCLK